MDAIAELLAQIQQTANSNLDPADRTAALTDLRERIVDVVAECDRHLALGHRGREAEASQQVRSRIAARGIAEARSLLVEEFAPAELDAAAVLSHDELDRLQEEGLLDEAAGEIVRNVRSEA